MPLRSQPQPSGLSPIRLIMASFADNITQNLPEILARDLAKSESLFWTRSMTAGAPAVSLASEKQQPPEVPQRNPGRAATKMLHRATSETALCPQQDNTKGSTDTARGHQQCGGYADKEAGSHHHSIQERRQGKMVGDQNVQMTQENDMGKARLFLNGLDEDWGSDSSADIEPGRSSPSVRIRKQSVTTAATSVEVQSVAGAGVENVGRASPTQRPEVHGARMHHKGGESWVDLGPDMLSSEEDTSGAEAPTRASGSTVWSNTQPAIFASDEDGPSVFVNVPRRRSSLSHQAPTVITGETPHTRLSSVPLTFNQKGALQLPHSSHGNTPHHPTSPFHHQPNDWDDCEAARSPIVPTSSRQVSRKPEYPPKLTFQDRLRPASPSTREIARNVLDSSLQKKQPPNLFNRLRKTQSHSKMHIVTQVQSWLDSSGSGSARSSPTTIAKSSPAGMTSLTSIRVSTEVLENLRIIVDNFPDTMLRTSSLTVQTIRSYSRKLKRGGITNDRAFIRECDEVEFEGPDSLTAVHVSALDRQPSFGNMKLKKLSLRGKLNLNSRLTASPTSPSTNGEDDFWRDFDNRCTSTQSSTPVSRKSQTEVSACVAALRCIFPNGTDYLLDALYAHIIAYNYSNSLCGGLPHLQNDGGGGHRPLRARPSMNFPVPPGVTSRADLKLQDPDDSVIREFEDDVASVATTAAVPKKAASLLGLGATNMGKPVKPRPGTLGGRRAKYRKTTPPAACFSTSLESESAMWDLRDAISVNIHRLVATVKSASTSASASASAAAAASTSAAKEDGEDGGGTLLGAAGAKEQLDPTLLRALCEVVRCYEELS